MRCCVLIVSLLTWAVTFGSAYAQSNQSILVRGSTGVMISGEDIRQELLLAPPEVREDILAKPELIRQTALALYSRRVLAEEALGLGLDKQEETAAALERARLKVLAETALTRRDGSPPEDEFVEKLAQSEYKANPDLYKTQEQARVAHVLIAKDKPNAREIAEEVRTKLLAGEKITDLAKAYSDDTGSKMRGGDLGMFSKGAMVKPFEDAVFAMTQVNEISPIVQTEFGFHVIQLYGKIKPYVRPFNEVKDQIKRDVLRGLAKNSRATVSDEIMRGVEVDADAISALSTRARSR